MSTKALDEALDWLENYLDHNPEAQETRRKARKELEAIRKGARDVGAFIGWNEHGGKIDPRLAALDTDGIRLLCAIAKEDKP